MPVRRSIGTDETCNMIRSYVTLCVSVTHSGSAGGQGECPIERILYLYVLN
jgi:hypothetical protein